MKTAAIKIPSKARVLPKKNHTYSGDISSILSQKFMFLHLDLLYCEI